MKPEIEQKIIGTIILYPDLLQDNTIRIQAGWFADRFYGTILETIQRMQVEGRNVSLALLAEEMHRKDPHLDAMKLFNLTTQSDSVTFLPDYVMLLQEDWLERQASTIGQTLLLPQEGDVKPNDKDIRTRLQEAEDALYALSEAGILHDATQIASDVDDAYNRIEEASRTNQPIRGVSSGFDNLDRKLLGFHSTDLIILAARPSQGKTALGVSFTRRMAQSGTPVAFFSLEMGREQIIHRLLMQESGLPGEVIRQGVLTKLTDREIVQRATTVMRNWPIYVDDTPSLSLMQLRQKCRKLVRKMGVKIVIIDYLQLMTSGQTNRNASRENEVSAISRGLKCLAKELHIPVMALAQLNRESERGGAEPREPRLSDLRESGAIEQDADVVMMLHFPKTAPEEERELIIAKHRNGATGSVLLKFDKPTAMFSPPEARLMALRAFECLNV